jgi:hypothetical protein
MHASIEIEPYLPLALTRGSSVVVGGGGGQSHGGIHDRPEESEWLRSSPLLAQRVVCARRTAQQRSLRRFRSYRSLFVRTTTYVRTDDERDDGEKDGSASASAGAVVEDVLLEWLDSNTPCRRPPLRKSASHVHSRCVVTQSHSASMSMSWVPVRWARRDALFLPRSTARQPHTVNPKPRS